MSFKNSLEIGKLGERLARKKFEEIGHKTKDSTDKAVDFYVNINKKDYTCEVKYDVYSNKSGNVCFEIFNTKLGKPSGIAGTNCDLWIHVLNESEILFATSKSLKKYTEETKPKRLISNAGDDNASILLYSKEKVCEEILVELNKDNIKRILSDKPTSKTNS